jgi:RNA polymerase sigma factor (sigma-70 family)
MSDLQLIDDSKSIGGEEAFRKLVDQYLGLVYSACLRQLKDRHLAEDATQAVFILISQKAAAQRQGYLVGWLLTACRYACANIRKSEERRQRREQTVAMNRTMTTEKPTGDLLDLLDEALCQLKPPDREALVLRYLKEQPISDVAQTLGISEPAARKRIDRAIERLRHYFSRRGIAATPAALATVLAEQISGAALAPAARQSITTGVLQACHGGGQSAARGLAIAKGTKTMMIQAKLKLPAAIAAAALLAGVAGTIGRIVTRASGENSPAAQATVPPNIPPAAAPDAAAAVPTTAPSSIDLSAPEAAARSFFKALAKGDRGKTYACLTADSNRPTNLMDAMLLENLAQNRLLRTVAANFGDSDAEHIRTGVTLDMVAHIIASGPNGPPPAVIDGNDATMSADLSMLIKLAPDNFAPILRKWSNKPLYFHKQSDGWKFDIDRSMRVVATMIDLDNRPLDKATTIQVMVEMAGARDEVCKRVDSGEILSGDGAVHALHEALDQIDRKYRVREIRTDVVPGH